MRPVSAARKLAHTGQSSLGADSMRDVEDRLEQIGLTPKTGWYVSILLYAAGGIPAVLAHLTAPEKYNTGFLVTGGMAITIALLSILGLRYFPNSHRATHVRLTLGASLIICGALVVGDAAQAFVILALVVTVPPAVYYGLRAALPYSVLAIPFSIVTLLSVDQSWAVAMAVCSTLAIVAVSVSMMVAQARTRDFARRNRVLAFTDALTGLANTRALNTAIERELKDPESLRAALFAIDLDDFKQVNDRFDHQRGDEVLKAVSEALVGCGEHGDLFARRGGDEFSLFITDSAGRDLGETSSRLGDAITKARKRVCPEVSPSGSVAFVYARPDDTVGSLLQRADDALHEAKVEYHSHDEPNRPVRLAIIDHRSESDRERVEALSSGGHPLRRAADADRKPRVRCMRGTAHGDRAQWWFAVGMNLVVGFALVVSGVAGLSHPFDALDGVLFGGGFLLLAGLSALAAIYPLRHVALHVVMLVALALLSGAILQADASGAAMLDLFVIVAVFAFHFFRSRVAALYLPVCIGLFAALAITISAPYAGAHVGVVALMVLSTAALTLKVRQVTDRFIDENWRLSQLDALTGLSNVRALRARIEETVKAARSGGPHPTLLAIDLDEFKQVNDSFSHTVGDRVLESVARAIADNVRIEDMVARRGGDEFMVVTSFDGNDEPEQVADRVREAIIRSRRRICPQLIPTASVAVVHWSESDDADAFMHRADVGLHEQKLAFRRGRTADAS
ncbi:MAG: diguanylate cyclase [Actinobacteria bacterium]|nr:diguanylate cyclase [Actinomycetota bacterium]